MTELADVNVSVSRDAQIILQDLSFAVMPGEFVALLGPNGAGKTTLLRAMLGFQALSAGYSLLDGQNVASINHLDRARKVSYLPQERLTAWPNTVEDVVALGRFAHGVRLGRLQRDDAAQVSDALEACDLMTLRQRRVDSLSGGELARVHCARVYASNAPLLLADEPTSGLDPKHQHRVLSLMRAYVGRGHGVLTVLHDLNLALRYADRIAWLKAGKLIAVHSPAQVTAEFVADIYGVEAEIVSGRVGEPPQILVKKARWASSRK